MRVDRVTAVLRYSAEAKGAWRTVELGAEATVDPEEDWALAQQGLYTRLTSQLREVWGWGKACPSLGRRNGHNPEHAQNGPEKPVEAAWEELKGGPPPDPSSSSGEPPAIPHYYCEKHKTQLRRYEKDGKTWYSHRTPDGSWCKG
jgi:hypothetical protein